MHDLPVTRHSLLVQLQAQSHDAWAELLLVYEGAIYRYCRARGLQPADACDATQEVFAAVHQRIGAWDYDASKGTFRGWLFRVARNIAIDKVTWRGRHATGIDSRAATIQLVDVADVPEEETTAFALEYRRALLRWAAEQVRPEVSDASWRAFQRSAVDGVDPASVAAELNMSVGAVYAAKCRIVAKIRARVAKIDDEDIDVSEMDK